MNWSLSEFLNLIELRSQSWCIVDLGHASGIRLPHSETIFFHVILEGSARLIGVDGEIVGLNRHDIAIVLSGDAHAVRNDGRGEIRSIELLSDGLYVDAPPTIVLGDSPAETRLLCGRLKVRWPSGSSPRGLPALFTLRAGQSLVDFDRIMSSTSRPGTAALLTRIASMVFTQSFRDHPRCQAMFQDASLFSPVSRAQRIIMKHPFQPWTVEALAKKVGMGRSNFASQFATQTGKTPMDMLVEERMKHAVQFLEMTDLKIAEISERIGYRSEAAFSRRFTDYFGTTPGKLRKQFRHEH